MDTDPPLPGALPPAESPNPEDAKAAEEAIRRLGGPEQKRIVEASMMMMMQGTLQNPLLQKFESEHIHKAIDFASVHDKREFDLANRRLDRLNSNRWFHVLVLVLILASVAGACVAFHEKTEILTPLLTGLFGLATGGLAGYGIGHAKASQD